MSTLIIIILAIGIHADVSVAATQVPVATASCESYKSELMENAPEGETITAYCIERPTQPQENLIP